MIDPIVAEVRKYRDEHARKFKYDINDICEDYKRKHKKYLELLRKVRDSISTDSAAWSVCFCGVVGCGGGVVCWWYEVDG